MKRADAEALVLIHSTRRTKQLRAEGFTPAAAESRALAECSVAYQSSLTSVARTRIRRALRERRAWTK